MKVIHIAQNTDGYEKVTLLANRVSRNNSLIAIQGEGEEVSYSGGFILEDDPEIERLLNAFPKEMQYDFVKKLKSEPFAKMYLEED
jgi:hypothetical protein